MGPLMSFFVDFLSKREKKLFSLFFLIFELRRFREEEKTYVAENSKFQGKIKKMEMELENYKMQLEQFSSSTMASGSLSSMDTVNMPNQPFYARNTSSADILFSQGQRKNRSKNIQKVSPMRVFPDNKYQIELLEGELNWYSDSMLQKLNQLA